MKRDGDEPKAGDELAPNAGVDVDPNIEGVVDEVDPKGLAEDDTPKGEEPKAEVEVEVPKLELLKVEVLGANRLEDVEVEKGLEDDCPNAGEGAKGLDGAAEAPKPIPPAD